MRRLVEFLVFNSIYLKKSGPSNGINRVTRRLVEFLMFNSIHWKKSDPASAENRVNEYVSLTSV